MSGVQPIHARRALIDDRSNLRVGSIKRVDGDEVHLTLVDRSDLVVHVTDLEALRAALEDPTPTLLPAHDARLAIVNEHYRLLGLAFGPPTPPTQLAIVAVVDLADSSIPSIDDQPGWRLLRITTHAEATS